MEDLDDGLFEGKDPYELIKAIEFCKSKLIDLEEKVKSVMEHLKV
jgi:hypothetical protein